jgi:DNA adenine methylase
LIKSCLKWPGGKSKLLDRLYYHFPKSCERYIEPFLGSAVVLINMDYKHRIGCDINDDLMNLYQQIRQRPQQLIDTCKHLFENGNVSETYYERRRDFNKFFRYGIRPAAKFIYLNRFGFNGLCRYNSKGEFNVPFGKYTKVHLPEKEIYQMHEALQNVALYRGNAIDWVKLAEPGDLVYCDPPYLPLSETANFTKYATEGFSIDDQRQLVVEANAAAERGATVIISNHDTPLAHELYGDHIVDSFMVTRTVSRGARNPAREIIAKYEPS